MLGSSKIYFLILISDLKVVLPIYIYGQPVLRKVAEDINADYPELKTLIADM